MAKSDELLPDARAAIHVERLTGDEGGRVGQQERVGFATSRGSSVRAIGMPLMYRWRLSLPGGLLVLKSSVAIGPGATAFTVMPSLASSSAQLRVKLISAVFAAA
ncbi:MAG: hypothetical protein R3F11_30970 [Verrucomicrobiales bacterium]